PLVPVVYQSLVDRPLYESGGVLGLDNFLRLFADAEFHSVVFNSFALATLTTVLTLVIAVPAAILIVRAKIPFGRTLGLSLQWPFFVSSLILGFGWIIVYGPAGFFSVQV